MILIKLKNEEIKLDKEVDFSEIIECKNESVKELIEIIKAYSDNYSDKQICISEKVLNSFNGQDRTKLVHIVFDNRNPNS